jgi:hypothetical protein
VGQRLVDDAVAIGELEQLCELAGLGGRVEVEMQT